MSVSADKVNKALDEYFRPWECTEVFPKIGEQYHYADELEKVYTACFADEEVFAELQRRGAHDCMLFTHHPAPQKTALDADYPPLSELSLKIMKENRINLFAYHIPLDRNGVYSPGNNLAKVMGARPFGEFYLQNKVLMGVLCDTDLKTRSDVVECLEKTLGHECRCYPYGSEELMGGRIAIMGGGAKDTTIYDYLIEQGVNCFICGVTNPGAAWIQAIHDAAKKAGVNLIGGTHYSTEKFAPKAMCDFFEKLGLESEFIESAPKLSEL